MDSYFRFIPALVFIVFVAHRAYYSRKLPSSQADTKVFLCTKFSCV